jgi:enamine deaminase RidA (YjgF/YER057c/UK114 family)
MTTNAEAKLKELGIVLPEATPPIANYVPAVTAGNVIYLAGHLGPGVGKLGAGVSVEEAYESARAAAIGQLARIRSECGSLNRVMRVVKVMGYVACTPEFTDHPRVINGASDLLVEIFGEAGKHARSAVGVPSLPLDAPVEVEIIVEIA